MKRTCLKPLMLLLMIVSALSLFTSRLYAQQDQLIYDTAHLLTEEEAARLNERALEITERYDCAVHFITVDDPNLTLDNIEEFSENLYLSSDAFGAGEGKDGFMLVLGTAHRCYWLLAYGDFANYALTDYGKDVMAEEFLDDFSRDTWFEGFQDYLDFSEKVLSLAKNGTPFDLTVEPDPYKVPKAYGIGAFAGLIAAFIICESYKRQMQTAVKANMAHQYMDQRGVDIAFRNDRFAYRTTTRAKIETSKSSGGTTVDRKGFSGKGGKF